MTIAYRVEIEDDPGHRALVTVRFDIPTDQPVDLRLPAWTPGSYRIDPYARAIQWLRAFRSGPEEEIRVERPGIGHWRLAAGRAGPVEVRYSIYGYGLVNEALDLTPEHLYLNAAMCLLFVGGRTEEDAELTLELPGDWTVVTELPPVAGRPRTYRARHYDELIDSPIDAGSPVVTSARSPPRTIRLSICGSAGNQEGGKFLEALARIADAADALFSPSHVEPYTFFVHLNDIPDGALEHANSSTCVLPRGSFWPEKDYQHVLAICCHEYIHRYNGRRIRPQALVRPDLTREVVTRLLWLVEGTTDYYAYLLLGRSGLRPLPKLLEQWGTMSALLLQTPGRQHRSLEDASFDSWIDLYRPYAQTPNQSVSYYLKGHLASLCLDLEIRYRTGNARSLDDVMRRLQQEHGETGKGLGELEFPTLVERACGVDLSQEIHRWVATTEELDLTGAVRRAGLRLGPPRAKEGAEKEPEPAYLGIHSENRDGLARITSVLDGGPGQRAGLSAGDELVAIDGRKVTFESLNPWMSRLKAGSEVEVTVFRRGLLTRRPLTLGAKPPEKMELAPVESPTEEERAFYQAWLGSPWPAPPKTEGSGPG